MKYTIKTKLWMIALSAFVLAATAACIYMVYFESDEGEVDRIDMPCTESRYECEKK